MATTEQERLRRLQEAVADATAQVDRYKQRLDTGECPSNWSRLLSAIKSLQKACYDRDEKRVGGLLRTVFMLADPIDGDLCSADLREEQRLIDRERRRLNKLNDLLIAERVAAHLQQASGKQETTEQQQESVPFDRPAVSNDPTQPGYLFIDVLGLPADTRFQRPLRDPVTGKRRMPETVSPTEPARREDGTS